MAVKCEVVHFGRSNARGYCIVNGKIPGSIDVQRNLAVPVSAPVKEETQVVRVVKKAYNMLAFISWRIEYKRQESMLHLE